MNKQNNKPNEKRQSFTVFCSIIETHVSPEYFYAVVQVKKDENNL